MKTGEFAAACGIEKRTLFYYDEIGLLKPARVYENGYREYDAMQIPRMETIKLLQAAGLSLEEIRSVLMAGDDPENEGDSGRNLSVALECCSRLEGKLARLNDSLSYLRQRIRIRESYIKRFSRPTLIEADGVRVFLEDLPMQPAAAIRLSGDTELELSYKKLGYYLGIAVDIRAERPLFIFKCGDAQNANVTLPGGPCACAFFEASTPREFDVAALTALFRRALDSAGLCYDDTVCIEDLPAWIIERAGAVVCRFAVRLVGREGERE